MELILSTEKLLTLFIMAIFILALSQVLKKLVLCYVKQEKIKNRLIWITPLILGFIIYFIAPLRMNLQLPECVASGFLSQIFYKAIKTFLLGR